MKFNNKTIYAMHFLILLHQKNHPTSLNELSSEMNLSKSYLEQIVRPLKISSIVYAELGNKGGYYLTKTLKDITLFSIIELFEPLLVEETNLDDSPIHQALNKVMITPIQNHFKNTLTSTTLDEISQSIKDQQPELMYYI